MCDLGLSEISTDGNEVADVNPDLDKKINESFPGAVVRKDLAKAVRGNAVVPSYVLEYLLGQYAASDDEETIKTGIENVQQILANHYVNRTQHELIKSIIRDKGRHRIIDKVTVTLNVKEDVHEAEFENLQVKGVVIDDATVKRNPKLLVGGVWCICDLEYLYSGDPKHVPWALASLKPIQVAGVDLEHYLEARKNFSTSDWIDLLMQSIGLNPTQFSARGKLIALTRLIPFVERNYNLVELGPKGTGKSHIYSEFSPNGILISGGEVTVAKLFVNNSSGKIGLVGYWDCVAFDEFAANKRTDANLVNVMKNYLANKQFSRGTSMYGAEASMAFIGNTTHTVPYMLKNSDLFDELPEAYRDPAWLDRIHCYLPGWEVAPIRSEMFSSGYGFVVDYLAEVLRAKRNDDFANIYQQYFTLDNSLSTRDQDGIRKTFSGLMKIIHPSGDATCEEIRELLDFAIEGRKRVKDSILRIDATMRTAKLQFRYQDADGEWYEVKTREQRQYPQLYHQVWDEEAPEALDDAPVQPALPDGAELMHKRSEGELFVGHRDFYMGQRGVSYDNLLLPYLKNASKVQIIDPYVRLGYQIKNLFDLIAAIASAKDVADEVEILLYTSEASSDEDAQKRQMYELLYLQKACVSEGIRFDVRYKDDIHDRKIFTDTGWRIDLGRGLDIWEKPELGAYSFARARQEFRSLKSDFTVHFSKVDTQEQFIGWDEIFG